MIAVSLVAGSAQEMVRICGKGARTKRISKEVFSLPIEERRAFLDGYLAGDGCRIRNYWSVKTASDSIACQISLLAESVGLRATTYRYPGGAVIGPDGRVINGGPFWQIYIYSRTREKNRKAPNLVVHNGVSYSLSRIKSIRRYRYDGQVWNLSIGDSPTFQTAIGMSHNTVKPLAITKYLSTLLLPPKLKEPRRILIPFAGSGSEAIGAMLAGWDSITAIEREADYCRIAEARLAWWEKHPDGPPEPSVSSKRAKREKGKSASLEAFR